MLRYLLVCCICFILCGITESFAQVTLRGEVFDATTGEPLIGANVVVVGTVEGTVTDFDGRYILKTEKTPPLTLTISYTGYDPVSIDISDASHFIKTKMTEANIIIDAVEVT